MFFKEWKKGILKRQLPFILDICNGRWFRHGFDLWEKELIEEKSGGEKLFVSTSERKETELNIRRMILDEKLELKDYGGVQAERQKDWLKSKNLKKMDVELRADVSQKLKKLGKNVSDVKQTFDEFCDTQADDIGRDFIVRRFTTTENKERIAQKWVSNKARYPYFTLFIKGLLYPRYYAMAHPNEPIDENSLSDIYCLIYIHGVDILVSNEEKFMKKAFYALFGDTNKKYMQVEEFLDYLKNLGNDRQT